MLKIDSETMTISMTRGDTVDIIFSAINEEGESFHPTRNDRLIFSVARKIGEAPIIVIMNEMTNDEAQFWSIRINPEHTEELKFGKYAFDVQLEIRNSESGEVEAIDTIIGKTDTISPSLILWGEITQESE